MTPAESTVKCCPQVVTLTFQATRACIPRRRCSRGGFTLKQVRWFKSEFVLRVREVKVTKKREAFLDDYVSSTRIDFYPETEHVL